MALAVTSARAAAVRPALAAAAAAPSATPPDPRPLATPNVGTGLGRWLADLSALAQRAVASVQAADQPMTGRSKRERKQARRAARQAAKQAKRQARRERQRAKPSTQRRLELIRTISGGGLFPKSIVADQRGHVFTMNMMYGHNITVFDRAYKRKKVMTDAVRLSKFGYRQFDAQVQGAPVEAAVTPDGRDIYVSNYSMYGPGFENPGFDKCEPEDDIDRGFVYRIDTKRLRKTAAIRVGRVPKNLAVTPNGRRLLVGNWCSWDISVVDLRTNREIKRIDAGVAPRGIAFSPRGRLAYVTLVGDDALLVIDMRKLKVKREIRGIGERPRHLVMSPGGRYLFVTVQGKDKPRLVDGEILKYDLRKNKVVARSRALAEPRTTVLSRDGKSLYVVDYHRGRLEKLKASDLSTIQSVYLGYQPIGVTYDEVADKVWVSGYSGSIWVLRDR
jgi:YVTN family beta-propeller protein